MYEMSRFLSCSHNTVFLLDENRIHGLKLSSQECTAATGTLSLKITKISIALRFLFIYYNIFYFILIDFVFNGWNYSYRWETNVFFLYSIFKFSPHTTQNQDHGSSITSLFYFNITIHGKIVLHIFCFVIYRFILGKPTLSTSPSECNNLYILGRKILKVTSVYFKFTEVILRNKWVFLPGASFHLKHVVK